MPNTIPLHRPSIGRLETSYVTDALTGGHLHGSGPYSARAVSAIRETLGCHDAILTTSGTDALEMTSLLLDLGPGDTVVVPSFTFASVATAFARSGARIRFADIETTTLGMDPDSLAGQLDDSVRAVVPVHYGGVACDLEGLREVLERYPRAELIEDNAHGLFATYRSRPLGTFGRLGVTSFHSTKTLTCGEGGALLINDPALVERAHVIAEKGTNRTDLVRGLVDKYTWRDIGSSFVLSDVLAAMLCAQLERAGEIAEKRDLAHAQYLQLLEGPALEYGLRLPTLRPGCTLVPHLFYVLMPTAAARDSMLTRLRDAGIGVAFHYVPLHSAPAARRFSEQVGDCPRTTDVSARLMRLPFFTDITEAEIQRVADALVSALRQTP